MSNRPRQVEVVTEVGYCPSCGRTRNLRHEQHHLGGLVRTIVTCETCHHTLSSSIGPAVVPEPAPELQPEPAPEPAEVAAPRRAAAKLAAKKPTAAKKTAAAKKPAVAKKPAARAGKPTSTATRKVTKRSR